jgi:hypothetical protein
MQQRLKQVPAQPTAQANPFAEVTRADCEHWTYLAKNVHDPVVAKLLVEFLDKEPDLRVKRSGVYLAAQACLHRHEHQTQAALSQSQARAQNAQAIGRAVAHVLHFTWKALKAGANLLGAATKVAVQSASAKGAAPTQSATPSPAKAVRTEPSVGLVWPLIDDLASRPAANS